MPGIHGHRASAGRALMTCESKECKCFPGRASQQLSRVSESLELFLCCHCLLLNQGEVSMPVTGLISSLWDTCQVSVFDMVASQYLYHQIITTQHCLLAPVE